MDVVFSARMPHLVSIIMESGAASYLVEDYAACLESRIKQGDATEISEEDTGSLILRVSVMNCPSTHEKMLGVVQFFTEKWFLTAPES